MKRERQSSTRPVPKGGGPLHSRPVVVRLVSPPDAEQRLARVWAVLFNEIEPPPETTGSGS
jgi:hypothetical protein